MLAGNPDVARRATLAAFTLLLGALTAHGEMATAIREAAANIEARPRILITPEQAAKLPENARSDSHRAHITEATIRKAEGFIDAPPLTREVQGRRMLHVSRAALDRITTLSAAWKITGETRFADRAIAEVQAVSAFENWNPSHFLDVAEMSLAVAIGYDWLYDRLDEETRTAARQAILEKALTPALSSDRHWWKHTTNNWNQVCHGGLLAGAIAVIDDHPEEALRIIEMTVKNVPTAMASYSPKGAYPEGPGYWSYGTTYNVVLLDLLRQNLGGTFGLDEIAGFSETGAFPMLMTAPTGIVFNFSDNRASRGFHPAIYWLASHYDRPEWTRTKDDMASELAANAKTPPPPSWSHTLATLLWRAPEHVETAPGDHSLPLHWFSHGEVPVSVHRESWTNPASTFLGVKAGSATASHGQMDIGSFIMEADGVRWAHDLGVENYHRIESRGLNLWNQGQQSDRWNVFRNNNLSHSTLTIDGQHQHAAGLSQIVRFSDDPAFPHTVIDMSPSYQGQLDAGHRGFAMLPGGSVLIRDHLRGLRPGAQVRWAMVTRAHVGSTSESHMFIYENDKTLGLFIHGGRQVHWESTDLATPPNEWDSPNEGYTMLSFTTEAPDCGELDFIITLRPLTRPIAELTEIHLAPPLEWSSATP